jgi:hypothetical protein
MLKHDEFRLKRRDHFSLAPLLRGEGWGEGLSRQTRTRGESPSPGLLRNPTSPRKRGEVSQTSEPIQRKAIMLQRAGSRRRIFCSDGNGEVVLRAAGFWVTAPRGRVRRPGSIQALLMSVRLTVAKLISRRQGLPPRPGA